MARNIDALDDSCVVAAVLVHTYADTSISVRT